MKKSFLPALLLILFILSGCQPPVEEEPAPLEGEPFAIYLLGDAQITSPELKSYTLADLPLNATPILTTDDLVDYDWERHGMNLTESAYFKLLTLFMSGLPSSGVPFVLVAYEQPVYAGAFWAPFSTLSFDGIVVIQPTDPAGQTLYIELGYPSKDNFTGEDPRAHPRLLQALQDEGLLRE